MRHRYFEFYRYRLCWYRNRIDNIDIEISRQGKKMCILSFLWKKINTVHYAIGKQSKKKKKLLEKHDHRREKMVSRKPELLVKRKLR